MTGYLIAAAVFGGCLTLAGVMVWPVIKNTYSNYKRRQKRRARAARKGSLLGTDA
jgi:hypothetical protein